MELVRCDFEDDQPLMDVGIDSLSATTLINRLEMKLDINLAGDGRCWNMLGSLQLSPLKNWCLPDLYMIQASHV